MQAFRGHLLESGKYLSGMWLGDGLRTDTKGHMFKRDWTSCLKFVNHSNWGGRI